MSAANKSKKQEITKQAPAAGKVLVNTAPANDGGFDNFQTTVSRKQRIETQKKGAEESKKEEVPIATIATSAPVVQA